MATKPKKVVLKNNKVKSGVMVKKAAGMAKGGMVKGKGC